MLIVLYEDLVHADFEPIQISEIGSRNAGLATHLLWERDHGLSTAVGAKYEEDQSAELAWLEDRIWTWGWYVQTKVLRGELYEAIGGLQYIRDRVLFRLLAMLREERPSSARRAESRVGPWTEKFAATVPRLTQESTMNALKSSIHLYVELTDLLHKKFSIEPADQARSAVLHALEQGLTWRSEDESVSRSVLRQGSKHHRRSRRT